MCLKLAAINLILVRIKSGEKSSMFMTHTIDSLKERGDDCTCSGIPTETACAILITIPMCALIVIISNNMGTYRFSNFIPKNLVVSENKAGEINCPSGIRKFLSSFYGMCSYATGLYRRA